jgi:DNA mismatch repair protein MutS
VARLAGLPEPVIARANEVLHTLEKENIAAGTGVDRSQEIDSGHEQHLFEGDDERVRARLDSVDINRITPLEAMNVLDELKRLLIS